MTYLNKSHYQKMTTAALNLRLTEPKANDDAAAIQEVLNKRAEGSPAPTTKSFAGGISVKDLMEGHTESDKPVKVKTKTTKEPKVKLEKAAKAKKERVLKEGTKFEKIVEGLYDRFKVGDLVTVCLTTGKYGFPDGSIVKGEITKFERLRDTDKVYVAMKATKELNPAFPDIQDSKIFGAKIDRIALEGEPTPVKEIVKKEKVEKFDEEGNPISGRVITEAQKAAMAAGRQALKEKRIKDREEQEAYNKANGLDVLAPPSETIMDEVTANEPVETEA